MPVRTNTYVRVTIRGLRRSTLWLCVGGALFTTCNTIINLPGGRVIISDSAIVDAGIPFAGPSPASSPSE